MNSTVPIVTTDQQRIDAWLAVNGQRTQLRVTTEGTTIDVIGKVVRPYRRRPGDPMKWVTYWWPLRIYFSTDGRYLGTNNRLRAWWLLRKSGFKPTLFGMWPE